LPHHPLADAPRPDLEQPPSIRTAVRLMWAGAVLSAVGVLATFTQRDTIREAVEDSDSSLTQSEIDTAVNIGVGVSVLFGVVGVGLWLWMAWANGQGKSWARVMATVFGALNLIGTVINLASASATGVGLALGLVGLVLSAVILVLLYRPESSRFYEAHSRAGW
jgi:uncharacterized membrane protein